ncbi:hypothetical protein HANVADRAFT_47507 [Hanseniaspora valbyensis NRRL Y-1626]|uniref:Large ribosomal subunit protein mL59 domain-containing protein n=1 Tax=Hanseniaspora valbyensis NRRL Y-1626 TaxID=766949 RepID=A0A1B7TI08_9ASCO|nr:hypothetical protein HANVADRAFT_47507 [Hanseniaspora valbyensis NRRL Y-1626]
MFSVSSVIQGKHNIKNALQHINAIQIATKANAPTETAYNDLFENLPTIVKNFFAKYPPNLKYKERPSLTTDPLRNPFLPNFNPVTKVWANPELGALKHAKVYKICYRYRLTDLLPKVNPILSAEERTNFVEPITNEVINLNALNNLRTPGKTVLKGYTKGKLFYEDKFEHINKSIPKSLYEYVVRDKVKSDKRLAKKQQMEKAIADMDNIIMEWKNNEKSAAKYLNRKKINTADKLKLFE